YGDRLRDPVQHLEGSPGGRHGLPGEAQAGVHRRMMQPPLELQEECSSPQGLSREETEMTGITRRSMLAGSAAAVGSLVVPLPHIMRKAAAQDTITIGVVTPLSGPQQLIGNFVKIGAEIGADYV